MTRMGARLRVKIGDHWGRAERLEPSAHPSCPSGFRPRDLAILSMTLHLRALHCQSERKSTQK